MAPPCTTPPARAGSVYDVIIDKRSGKADYAIMSFGGFLGIGDSYHPLPWQALTYDEGQGGYVVVSTARALKGRPPIAQATQCPGMILPTGGGLTTTTAN